MQQLDDRLVSRLAHDLKSPLASVREALHLLEAEKLGGLKPRQKEIVGLCLRNSDRLWSRLAKLAEWYRLAAGLVEFAKHPASLNTIASQALADVQSSQEGSVTWDYQPPPEDLVVDGDSAKLQLMMAELLQNAAVFSEPGSQVVVELDTGIPQSPGFNRAAIFRVRHPGAALSGVEEPDILAPFYPLRQERSTPLQGLGLGLPIALAIASAHGGGLRWSCHQQQGTIFEAWLPLGGVRTEDGVLRTEC